jgi:hypothetical protein
VVVVLVLRLARRWPMTRFGIRGHSRSEGTAKSAAYDRAVSTTDFVAYRRSSGPAKPTAYCSIDC